MRDIVNNSKAEGSIPVQSMHRKGSFRRVEVNPAAAVNVGYDFDDFFFIDLQLQLGLKREARRTEGVGKRHSTDAVAGDSGIGDKTGLKSSGHNSSSCRRAHRRSFGTAARDLHGKSRGTGGRGGQRTPFGRFQAWMTWYRVGTK